VIEPETLGSLTTTGRRSASRAYDHRVPLDRPHPRKRLPARRLAALLAIALCACTTTPVPEKPSAPSALTTERQWLQSWFKGTPVVIAQPSDGSASVEVPREFCFTPGRTDVRPALGAVLDKMAESLRRVPALRLPLIAAPEDGAGESALALKRATQVRTHLVSRGVPPRQLGTPSAATAAAVQLRLELARP
jgi:outer membrane protein OmpA-like peptidoglycan-associated protein